MTIYPRGNPSVPADIGQINPKLVNIRLLKDILKILEPIVLQTLPQKRSGYSYAIYALYQSLIQITGLSPNNLGKLMDQACKDADISFQGFIKSKFTNSKQRRFFPDQPGLSRCLNWLAKENLTEGFWNSVLFSHFLLLRELGIIRSEVTLIADYTSEPCKKNKEDPYCFGTKEGKTVHKTLTFSIIAGDLHQIIANYKIRKYQNKLPIFKEIIDMLQTSGFNVKYGLLDRGFYRKRLLTALKKWKITTIMPGRKCAQTQMKIHRYLTGQGSRYCKGFTKQKYVKGVGYSLLRFDLLLCAKRSYNLNEIKRDFQNGILTLDEASKRIFPLIVLFGNSKGITTLHGNETYIRYLYRCRWWIEIAFREMNRLGISNRVQCRNVRLGIMGAKSLVYNFWQVQRLMVQKTDPLSPPLELNEFIGRTLFNRYRLYITA